MIHFFEDIAPPLLIAFYWFVAYRCCLMLLGHERTDQASADGGQKTEADCGDKESRGNEKEDG